MTADENIYYARFTEEELGGYSIDFPNIDGAYTEGDTIEEGLEMAKECLSLHLYGLIKDGDEIPEQPVKENIELQDNQKLFEIVANPRTLHEIIICNKNNYKDKFKELIETLSECTFFEFKGWLAHNFADITDGFDEDLDEEYMNKLRTYIDNLEKAYIIKQNILGADVEELPEVFDFDKMETQELIFESIEGTLQHLIELFTDTNTFEVDYSDMDELTKRDIQVLSDFVDNVVD